MVPEATVGVREESGLAVVAGAQTYTLMHRGICWQRTTYQNPGGSRLHGVDKGRVENPKV